ncbi:hypothetical protein RCOM_1043560 [Ricinus communis]|uniref:NB-ARC domain-containing protein n=1 Tax=Ricinus communis TaxID=3988 RepID=B9SBT6_RICCO|nr:hypothetical protein RCOM_1043560 [Ricinus communis]
MSPIDADGFVGIDSRIEEIQSLLCLDSESVRSIGIWGMGGIENLEKENDDPIPLLEKLISGILKGERVQIESPNILPKSIKHRLQRMKVLIVLDDVNEVKQLESLVGSGDWFAPGSRIIITSRDLQVLNSKVDEIYKIEGEMGLGIMAVMGNEAIEGILLNMDEVGRDIYLSHAAFSNMDNLRILKFYSSSPNHIGFRLEYSWSDYFQNILSNNKSYFQCLPNKLSLLHWRKYPCKSFPFNFMVDNLVEVNMRASELEQLWNGDQILPEIPRGLKVLELDSTFEKRQEWFAALQFLHDLEILSMSNCKNLRHCLFIIITSVESKQLPEAPRSTQASRAINDTPSTELYISANCKKFCVIRLHAGR